MICCELELSVNCYLANCKLILFLLLVGSKQRNNLKLCELTDEMFDDCTVVFSLTFLVPKA